MEGFRSQRLIACSICMDNYSPRNVILVGIDGGMPEIIEAMEKARKAISLKLYLWMGMEKA